MFLQRELTATLLTWEWLLKRPFVFDVDDAIFSRARGRSADRIATQAAITICGNRFLAEHFAAFGEVVVIPTAVDDELFCPLKRPQQSTVPVVIGWSGSSSGFEYLYMVEDAIQSVLDQIEGAIFKVVSDRSPEFGILDPRRVVFERWSPAREVEVLREFTVGLMPLRDSVWARGKCSYKMLTYMAVGIPVVVSPVGMNVDVLSHGACGYPAKTRDEWIDALLDILRNPSGAEAMGLIGRRIVEARYSKRVIAPQLIQVLGGI